MQFSGIVHCLDVAHLDVGSEGVLSVDGRGARMNRNCFTWYKDECTQIKNRVKYLLATWYKRSRRMELDSKTTSNIVHVLQETLFA